jgi:hypothetical protein
LALALAKDVSRTAYKQAQPIEAGGSKELTYLPTYSLN